MLLISCTPLFSQQKVLSEIGQVCGEIKKSFIFVWNRSGWAASRSFYWPVSEQYAYLPTGRKAATGVWCNW